MTTVSPSGSESKENKSHMMAISSLSLFQTNSPSPAVLNNMVVMRLDQCYCPAVYTSITTKLYPTSFCQY